MSGSLKLDHQMKQKIDLLGVLPFIRMPMVMEDKLHGVIQIATRDTKFFDQEKINILTQMANELAVGIARQRLRDALEESNRQLLKKHKELENATMQLLQSEKMASIGQLAAGIAHEINNPMGFINANLSVLDEYRKDLQETFNSYETTLGNYASEDTAHKHEPDLAALKVRKEQVDIKGLFEDFAALIKESREGAERVKRIIINLKEFSHPDKGVIELADLNAGLEEHAEHRVERTEIQIGTEKRIRGNSQSPVLPAGTQPSVHEHIGQCRAGDYQQRRDQAEDLGGKQPCLCADKRHRRRHLRGEPDQNL